MCFIALSTQCMPFLLPQRDFFTLICVPCISHIAKIMPTLSSSAPFHLSSGIPSFTLEILSDLSGKQYPASNCAGIFASVLLACHSLTMSDGHGPLASTPSPGGVSDLNFNLYSEKANIINCALWLVNQITGI